MNQAQSEFIETHCITEFNPRLEGIPHPGGTYTGETYTENERRFYIIDSPLGSFETTDRPIHIIDLTVYPPGSYYRIEEI